jgi:hypothetical protein
VQRTDTDREPRRKGAKPTCGRAHGRGVGSGDRGTQFIYCDSSYTGYNRVWRSCPPDAARRTRRRVKR